MEPLMLKKSCDGCTHSKVKCSGGYPCERCVQKKFQCFYSPRKKRMKPKKKAKADMVTVEQEEGYREDVIVSQSSFDPTAPLGSLVDWERRSWSVFFTLYKHYGTSCSLHWFNRQLNKMRTYLSRQGNTESLRRLTAWMQALNIDIDGLAAQVERCRIKCFIERSQLSLQVKGKVRDEKRLQPILQQTSEKKPFIKLTTSYSPNLEEDDVKVDTNKAFGLIFGINEKAIKEQLKWTGGGFLPWGGDILSRLLTQEKDLLAFVQILAIKFNTLGPPKELPTVRDVPSCHMFEVNIKEAADSFKLKAVNALVKCMHREIMTEERSYLEITMEFTPLAPHEHLLNADRFSNETCLLDIERTVMPFPTHSSSDEFNRQDQKKRNINRVNSFEGESESEEDEEDETKDSYDIYDNDIESNTIEGLISAYNQNDKQNSAFQSSSRDIINRSPDMYAKPDSRRSGSVFSKVSKTSFTSRTSGNSTSSNSTSNTHSTTSSTLNSMVNGYVDTTLPIPAGIYKSNPVVEAVRHKPRDVNVNPLERVMSFETGAMLADDVLNKKDEILGYNSPSGNQTIGNQSPSALAFETNFDGLLDNANTDFESFLDDVSIVGHNLSIQPTLSTNTITAGFPGLGNGTNSAVAGGPVVNHHSRNSDTLNRTGSASSNFYPSGGVSLNDVFEEQTEWLDGLLDWANKQDLVIN